MTKAKSLMIIVLLISVLLVVPNIAMATTDTITSERIVTATNGSIDFIIKGLDLEDGASYEWAIEKSQNANITNWYSVTAPEYDTGSIKIRILTSDYEQLKILRSTDIAYVTVRKVGEEDNILENYKVDLTLPLLKAFTVEKSEFYDRTVGSNPAFEIKAVYGINADNVEYKWEKITDPDIINNYIDSDHDLSNLNLKGKESFPSLLDTTWKTIDCSLASKDFMRVNNEHLPSEDGLYYLWLKGSSTDVKTIYGQAVLEVGEVKKVETKTDDGKTETPSDSKKDNGTVDSNKTDNGSQNQQPSTGTTDNQGSQTTQKNDQTTATGELPKAGLTIGVATVLILTLGVAISVYFKYNKLKDIK